MFARRPGAGRRRAAGLPGGRSLANLAYQRLASPLMTRAQQLRAEVSEIAHESFDGALVVKTLGREGEETDRFAAKAHELRDVNIRAGRVRAAFDPALEALPNLGVLVVLAVGVAPGAQRRDRRRRRGHRRLPAHHRRRSRSARSAGCSASSRAASSASDRVHGGARRDRRDAVRRRAGCRAGGAGAPARGRATSATPTTPDAAAARRRHLRRRAGPHRRRSSAPPRPARARSPR